MSAIRIRLEPWAEEFIDSLGAAPGGLTRINRPVVHFRRERDPLLVIASGRTEADGRKWIHVSASHPRRTPTWETMSTIKRAFLGDRRAIQVHPPRAEHVNLAETALHLWCCLDDDGLPDFRAEGLV